MKIKTGKSREVQRIKALIRHFTQRKTRLGFT
jgi:hypothetical protein